MPHPCTFVALAAAQIDSDGRQWIEVIPTADKARNGPWYFTITRDDLEAYAASIRNAGDRTPIDYDHSYQEGQGTRAAGWFTGQADVVDGDSGPVLRAEVQWTPAAIEAIKAGEYRFISPEFDFADRDQKTGLLTKAKNILAATLTNRPFFRELAPVGAVVWESTEGLEQLRQKVYAELNPGGFDAARFWVMDISAGRALVQEYQTSRTYVVPFAVDDQGRVEISPVAAWTEAQQEWVDVARAAIQANNRNRPFNPPEGDTMDLIALAKSLGLPEDADEPTIMTAAQAAHEKATKTDELTAENATLKAAADAKPDADRVAKLEADLASERTLRLVGERDTLLKAAVASAKIDPSEKEPLVEAFGGDKPTADQVAALAKILDARPTRSLRPVGHAGGGDAPAQAIGGSEFAYTVGGKEVTVDDESLAVHAKAEEILAAAGKPAGVYTEDEYVAALAQAGRQLATVS